MIVVLIWLNLDAEVLVLPPPVLSSGLFLLAADLRRHVSLRVSISQSTGILGIPLPALLSNTCFLRLLFLQDTIFDFDIGLVALKRESEVVRVFLQQRGLVA